MKPAKGFAGCLDLGFAQSEEFQVLLPDNELAQYIWKKFEMQDKKWLWGGIALHLGTGYTIAYLVYQIGTLITTGNPGAAFIPGLIAVAAMVAVIVALIHKTNKKFKTEYKLTA